MLDRLYHRVLGCLYQALGDAELAAQATEAVFVQPEPLTSEKEVWTMMLAVLVEYLARGFVVQPLRPPVDSWQADLLHGLAQLTPFERVLLLLRYHEGLSIQTLAQVLHTSEYDVRSQIARVRSRLLDAMRDA
jgi:hypothetical protein